MRKIICAIVLCLVLIVSNITMVGCQKDKIPVETDTEVTTEIETSTDTTTDIPSPDMTTEVGEDTIDAAIESGLPDESAEG